MMGNEFGIESMGICGIEQTTSYYPTEAVKVYSEWMLMDLGCPNPLAVGTNACWLADFMKV